MHSRAARAKALCSLVLVSLLLQAVRAPQLVLAEPAGVAVEDPAGYRELLAAALDEYENAHFRESQSLMLRAHTLFPNARTLRGLGMVSFELREYAESVGYFEAALASEQRALTPELRSETAQLLVRARAFTGRLQLAVTPANAQVTLDGEPLAAPARAVTVSVGEHIVSATAPGLQREQRKVVLRGGDSLEVRLQLLADTSHISALGPPSAPGHAEHRGRRWLWASIGAVIVAGAAAGVAVALTRREPGSEPTYRGLSGELPLKGPAP